MRYAEGLGWLTWDGTRWRRDDVGEVERMARDTVRRIYAEAAEEQDSERRRALAIWARASESARAIRNMITLAQSELGIASTVAVFDRNPWLLNCASGLVDLKTGDCGQHDSGALITKIAPHFFREGAAACPGWLTFLDRIMRGNLGMVDFLQRAAGYSITGDTSEQCFFLLYGTGANGKSTFLETLRSVLGDYAMHTPADTLMQKTHGGGGIPNDLARLRGARFVTATETEAGRRLAEVLVKQVTGGDTIAARFLHREWFEFRATFKVWVATNHKPTVRGTEDAIWRRIRLVPFEVTIPEENRDRKLAEKLLTESAGILTWAVEGCRLWQQTGLDPPDAVTTATATYKSEQDPVAQFIDDRCLVEAGRREQTGVLYSAFRVWCEKNGRHVTNSMTFSLRLQERGLASGRDRRGRFFDGIALTTEEA